MVPEGHYVVLRASTPPIDLALQGFERRLTLTHYHPFLRYIQITFRGQFVFVNDRGDVLILHPLPPDRDSAGKFVHYEDECLFQKFYQQSLHTFKEITGISLVDFDDVFLLWFGAPDLSISWNDVALPTAGSNYPLAIFLEALFVYALCRTSERSLSQLMQTDAAVATRTIVACARDLVFVERPEHFLVNTTEVNLMQKFYEAWGLSKDVASLQARFSQVIQAYSLHYTKAQARKSDTLNRLVATGGILALLAVLDPIHSIFPSISQTTLSIGVIFLAGGMLFSIVFDEMSFALHTWRDSHHLQARVRRSIRRHVHSTVDETLNTPQPTENHDPKMDAGTAH